MNFSTNQLFIVILFVIISLSCEKYQLCSKEPEVDTNIAFKIVDEDGTDLVFDRTYHPWVVTLDNINEENIVQSGYREEENEQVLFYFKTLDNISINNDNQYILQYSFFEHDTITINAEWTQNACDVKYSKINSISRGSTEFEQVDNVFLIVKD